MQIDLQNDLGIVFTGISGASNISIYGIDNDGNLIRLFDPLLDYTVPPIQDDWIAIPQIQPSTPNFARVGPDLFFSFEIYYFSEDGFEKTDVQVMRLTEGAVIETGVLMPDLSQASYGPVFHAPVTAIGAGEDYYFPVTFDETMPGQVYITNADGTLRLGSTFTRPTGEAGPKEGMTSLGEDVFFIGNERTPLDVNELWRIGADGSFGFVFADSTGSVISVATFDDAVWFLVRQPPQQTIVPELWRLGADGVPVQIDTLSDIMPSRDVRLKVVDDQLYMLGLGTSPLVEVAPDGSLTPLLDGGLPNTRVGDLVSFAGSLYFVGDYTPEGALTQRGMLFRVEADGTASRVETFGIDLAEGFAGELVVVADLLYFRGGTLIDDGFGGTTLEISNLHVMDADENVTRLTGAGTAAPSVRAVNALFAYETDISFDRSGVQPAITARDDIAAAIQDGPQITGNVLDNDDGAELEVIDIAGSAANVGTALTGTLGTLTLEAGGGFTYFADNAVHLPEGETAVDVFTYRVADSGGEQATARLSITVTGVNDPASITGDTSRLVVEDDSDHQQAGGVLIVTDPDAGEDRFADPGAGPLEGAYGSFTFDPDTGAWSYTLDNDAEAVRALTEGAEVFDSLTVTSLDGTASETITVTIQGTGVRSAGSEPDRVAQLQGFLLDNAERALEGVSVTFTSEGGVPQAIISDSSGRFGFDVELGLSGHLHATRAYDPLTDGRLSASDALEVLRLAVGLEPSWGPARPMDFIAADINQDGRVTAADTLEVLRSAVGLESQDAPRWVFLDAEADLSSVNRNNTEVETGIRIDALAAGLTEVSMTAILLGNMQEYA